MNNTLQSTINQIQNISPFDQQETVDKQIFLDTFNNHPECLYRTNLLFHCTASAFLVNPQKTKALMAFHNIYNAWSLLGGHTDGETDFFKVAKTEVQQESGIKEFHLLSNTIFAVDILSVIAHIKNGTYITNHLHFNITYLLQTDESQKLVVNPNENTDLQWLPVEDIIQQAENQQMKSMYTKLVNKLNKMYPKE